MLEEFYNQELVWITLINKGYVEFTKNFLKSMIRSKCNFKLIVYCTDEFVAPALSEYTNCVCLPADVFLRSAMPVEARAWGNKEYKKLCFAKLDAIQFTRQRLRNNGVKYVGFIDTDIVLFSDPSIVVKNYFLANPECKVLAQCDEVGEFCSFRKGCERCNNFCAGIIIFQTVEEFDFLFHYVDENILQFTCDDQGFLQIGFQNAGIECHTIPKAIFMNGGYKFAWKLPRPKDSCLLHFNYLVGGPMKKKKMIRMRMWYL